eukprot:460313-Pleurochrysis_carterae.AAC.1
MAYGWGHPVATLPSDEGDYTSLLPRHKFCESEAKLIGARKVLFIGVSARLSAARRALASRSP